MTQPVKQRFNWQRLIIFAALFILAVVIALPDQGQISWGRLFNNDQALSWNKENWSFQLLNRSVDLTSSLPLDGHWGEVKQVAFNINFDDIEPQAQPELLAQTIAILNHRAQAQQWSSFDLYLAPNQLIAQVPATVEDLQLSSLIQPSVLSFKTQTASQAAVFRERFAATQDQTAENFDIELYLSYLDSFAATALTGQHLAQASLAYDNQNQPLINLEFNDEGRELLTQLSTDNLGSYLGVFIDDGPITTAAMTQPITNGQAMIGGSFDAATAQELIDQLNGGSLPLTLSLGEQQTFSSTFGSQSFAAWLRVLVIIALSLTLLSLGIYQRRGLIWSLLLGTTPLFLIALAKLSQFEFSFGLAAGLIFTLLISWLVGIAWLGRWRLMAYRKQPLVLAKETSFLWRRIRPAVLFTLIAACLLLNPFSWNWLSNSLINSFGLGVVLSLLIIIAINYLLIQPLLNLTEKKQHD